jgi:hypothetical protein
MASRAASCGCLPQLVWLSELRTAPPMVVRTGAPLGAPRLSSSLAKASTLAGSTTTRFVPYGSWTHGCIVSVWHSRSCHHSLRSLVALPLLPPSSPRSCSVVHDDCSGATFSTAPSCSPAAILPLHCNKASFAGSRSSPLGMLWPPVISCFKCFRRMFSSVSSRCCICCNGYIYMLQVYVSCYEHIF